MITDTSDFSASILNGKIEKLTEAGSKNAAIKIVKDQKVINVSSSDLNTETLHGLIDRSVKRAPLLNPDPFSALPEKEDIKIDPESLKIYDEAIATMSPQAKIERAIKLEKISMGDKRVKKCFGSDTSTFIGINYLANSNGLSNAYRRTSIRSGIYLQSGEGDNLFDEGKSHFSRRLDALMSPEDLAREAVFRVTRLIGAGKIPTEKMPVVLEPSQSAMILGFLYACVNGNNIFRKQSFLADKLNQKIGPEYLTVIDDGLIPGAPGTKPFDGEGVPVRKTTVLEKGILKNFLMDTYAARKLKMKSTGNGSGANNLYIQPGKHRPEEIIKKVKKGLLLTGTMAFGLNSVTGDISKGAFGMLIENGQVTKPVAEITISGNLAEVLNNISIIGNDLKHTSSIVAPTMLISEMTIGGK